MDTEKNIKTPVVLVVIDGFGISSGDKESFFSEDEMPFIKQVVSKYPVALLEVQKNKLSDSYFSLGGEGRLVSFFEENNLRQLKIAEAEKYAYLSYFFNGRNQELKKNEEKIIIPSKIVDNYSDKPNMSTSDVIDKAAKSIKNNDADFIVISIANIDMLSNTEDKKVLIKSIRSLDKNLKKIAKSVFNKDGFLFIVSCKTANNNTRKTQKEALPFLMINKKLEGKTIKTGEVPGSDLSLMQISGTLSDVTPTIIKSISGETIDFGKSLIN